LLYLVATILLNVIVFTVLKSFPRFGIHPLQAIVANYVVCVITGCLFTGIQPFTVATTQEPWLPWGLLMGVAFIAIFNLTAYCSKVSGMASTVIASKLSLVIPVIFSIIVYKEAAGNWKIIGLLLAFPAVYHATRTPKTTDIAPKLLWPVLLFLFSGSLDTLVNYIQGTFLHTQAAQAACTIICFATAGTSGLIVTSALVATGKMKLEAKNLIAGICLGIPNFFSIYFLIITLNSNLFQSSATIPLINISILVASTVTAILVFRESANRLRILGLALAVAAILLIGFGDTH
jgi:drug/metabolite transporter (DMT)-like permease